MGLQIWKSMHLFQALWTFFNKRRFFTCEWEYADVCCYSRSSATRYKLWSMWKHRVWGKGCDVSSAQATGTITLTNLGPWWTLLRFPSGCKDNKHLQWCLKAQWLENRTGIVGGQRKWWTQTHQYESATGLVLGQKPGQFSSVQFSMKPGTDIYIVCRRKKSGQVRAHRQFQESGLLANSPTAANSPSRHVRCTGGNTGLWLGMCRWSAEAVSPSVWPAVGMSRGF